MLRRCGSSKQSRSHRRIYYVLSLEARYSSGRSMYRYNSLSNSAVAVYLYITQFVVITIYFLTLEFDDRLVSKGFIL